MSDLYDDMQAVATELLTEFAQGTAQLKPIVAVPGANPWDAPTEVPAFLPPSAAAKRLHQRCENGVADRRDRRHRDVRGAEIEPLLTNTLAIDGVERFMTNLTAIPPSGTVVAYKAWRAV